MQLVHQDELSNLFGEYGDIVSIDLIPPRGCAFICMNRRQDASRALHKLRDHKMHNKAITIGACSFSYWVVITNYIYPFQFSCPFISLKLSFSIYYSMALHKLRDHKMHSKAITIGACSFSHLGRIIVCITNAKDCVGIWNCRIIVVDIT